jgi:hypothetical protein
VRVPDTPPSLRVVGPRLVRLDSVHAYRAVVSDRDRDRVVVRWWLNGRLVRGRSRVDRVRFTTPAIQRLAASADDGHGARVRARMTVRVR